MDFIDQIKQFAKRVETLKPNLQTEEATKTALIMPFFSLLGYDVFNPDEFVPEYTADVGIKKGEKVDYAIMNNGDPVILIECKWIGENLESMTVSCSGTLALPKQNSQFLPTVSFIVFILILMKPTKWMKLLSLKSIFLI